jgi:hypothetical protein
LVQKTSLQLPRLAVANDMSVGAGFKAVMVGGMERPSLEFMFTVENDGLSLKAP